MELLQTYPDGYEPDITALTNEFGESTLSVMLLPLKEVPPDRQSFSTERHALLAIRLFTIVLLVVVLTMHVRSLRVFRWEQSVSGGVLVTYCVAVGGLALSAGTDHCENKALQAYICSTGAALLLVNSATIWRRWRSSGELTQVVAELLFALGVPLKRQVMIKVVLSGLAAVALLLDLALIPIMSCFSTGKEIQK